MKSTPILQARMGSSRLPGKVMLPLGESTVLGQNLDRVSDSILGSPPVVATSKKLADDIIEWYSQNAGVKVYRGSESNVLQRMYQAADLTSVDIIVRITADCPLVSPDIIDFVIERLDETGADYCSNIIERTFPRGLDVEAFTFDSFNRVRSNAKNSHQREHVTPYYLENPGEFELVSVTSDEVFDEPRMIDRTDLRFTLDEADDYELLRTIYENIEYDDILDVRDAVRYVDENDLADINAHVEQKST